MADLILERVESDADRTVLIHANESGPLAVGVATDGVNYLCSGCSRLVLQGVYMRQFLSIVIRCVRCGAIGATPTREVGEPVPAYSVVAPVAQYLIGGQINVPGPGMFAARDAAEDFAFEVGARYSERANRWAATFPLGTSPAMLRPIANLGRDLLGDRFDHFNAMYERSERHSTPHAEHHRLVGLIRYGEKAANQIQSATRRSQVTVDANRISELYTAVEMFHRWRNHPAWPHLVASLHDPSHVQHTVMLMALASVLADAGNGVGIVHASQSGTRIPDAWLAVDSHRRLDVEIKTPRAFSEPRAALTFDGAVDVIEKHILRAGSAHRGQILQGRPGLIGFGAFHLGPGGLELLERAAHEVLRRRGGRRTHIAAIVVVEATYQTTEIRSRTGKLIATNMQPTLQNRIALNSDYTQEIPISTDLPHWQTMPGAQRPAR
jgi:hypothetical protein